MPIQYKDDINFIKNKLNEIIQKCPLFKNVTENYFINYKMEYFINDDYNYNLFMKLNLGKKYKLRWDAFLNFLNHNLKEELGIN